MILKRIQNEWIFICYDFWYSMYFHFWHKVCTLYCGKQYCKKSRSLSMLQTHFANRIYCAKMNATLLTICNWNYCMKKMRTMFHGTLAFLGAAWTSSDIKSGQELTLSRGLFWQQSPSQSDNFYTCNWIIVVSNFCRWSANPSQLPHLQKLLTLMKH